MKMRVLFMQMYVMFISLIPTADIQKSHLKVIDNRISSLHVIKPPQ